MSCMWTWCNVCGHVMNHKLVNKCEKCGSEDVHKDKEDEP